MKNLVKNAIVFGLTAIAVTSCGYNNDVERANGFVENLGSDYYVAKGQTAQPGYAVIKHNGGYFAIYMKDYSSSMDSAEDYMAEQSMKGRLFGGLNYDNAGMYFDPRSGLTFDETAGQTKDLEKAQGFVEKLRIDTATEKLAELGLSEERGLTVAKLINNYEKVKSQRALTNADADAFARGVLGVSIKEAQEAYAKAAQGDKSQHDELVKRTSDLNGITPEHTNSLIEKFFAQKQ